MKYLMKNNKEYEEYSFEGDEPLFEKEIIANAKSIFGEKTVYIDLKMLLKTKKGKEGTIPDGYLLDFTVDNNPQLYLVENEVRNHSVSEHIGPQLMKFHYNYKESFIKIKNEIINYLNKANISVDKYIKKTEYRNLDDLLTSLIMAKELGVIVLIDDADERLYELKRLLNINLEIIVFKKYISKDNDYIYSFDKFNEQQSYSSNNKDNVDIDTVIVPAFEDGFQKEFIGNNRWYAVSIGINKLDSLKYIAVYQKTPVKAITYYAEIANIEVYQNTGKYIIYFKGKAKKLKTPIPLNPKNPNRAPQGRVYTSIQKILNATSKTTLDDLY